MPVHCPCVGSLIIRNEGKQMKELQLERMSENSAETSRALGECNW